MGPIFPIGKHQRSFYTNVRQKMRCKILKYIPYLIMAANRKSKNKVVTMMLGLLLCFYDLVVVVIAMVVFSVTYFLLEAYFFPSMVQYINKEYGVMSYIGEEEWGQGLKDIEAIRSILSSNKNDEQVNDNLSEINLVLNKLEASINNNFEVEINKTPRVKNDLDKYGVVVYTIYFKKGSLAVDSGYMDNKVQLYKLKERLIKLNESPYGLYLVGSSSSEQINTPNNRVSDDYSLSKARANSVLGYIISGIINNEGGNMPAVVHSVGSSNELAAKKPLAHDRKVVVYVYPFNS